MLVDQLWVLLAILGVMQLLLLKAGRQDTFRILLFSLLTFLPALLLINVLFQSPGKTVWIELPGGFLLTGEPVLYALTMAVKIIAVIQVFFFAGLISSQTRMLNWLMTQFPSIAIMAQVSMRAIPKLQADWEQVFHAQRLRLQNTATRWLRIRHYIHLWKPMLHRSLSLSQVYAEALASRGYGSGPRSVMNPIGWLKQDIIVSTLSFSGLIILMTCEQISVVLTISLVVSLLILIYATAFFHANQRTELPLP